MKLLLTNDDGIDHPGLAALRRVAQGFGQTTVVAPTTCWSSCGHGITTKHALRLDARGEDQHALVGTPADCVRLALFHVLPDADWVLAGINPGGNLGADVFHSGTVAAAREATLHGRRAVAFSQYQRRDREIDWERAAHWATMVLARLLEIPLETEALWNVNLPHLERRGRSPRLCFARWKPRPCS